MTMGDSAPLQARLRPSRSGRIGPFLWAFLVFVVGIAATFAAYRAARVAIEDKQRSEFQAEARDVAYGVADRMNYYEQALWGGAALFGASHEVTRQEWHAYVEFLGIQERLPGVLGVGFAQRILPPERDAHIRSVRAQGFPDYSVWPEGVRDEYTSIVFLEPFDWRNQRAFGYDMWTDPTRHAAMMQARDTGKATLSGKVTLVQETDKDVQAGFLLYVPVYRKGASIRTVEQRRAALIGYVYSPFRASDFLDAALAGHSRDIQVELYDGDGTEETKLLAASNVGASPSRGNDASIDSDVVALNVANHPWTFRVSARNAYSTRVDESRPLIVLIAGCLLTALAAGSVGVHQRKRMQLLDANERLTASEAKFRRLFADSPLPMWVVDRASLRFLEVNAAATQKYGYSREQFLAMTLADIHLPEDEPALAEGDGPRGAAAKSHKLRDGRVIETEATWHGTEFEGVPARLFVVRDVTDRHRVVRDLHDEIERRERAETLLRDAVDSVSEGFVIFDAEDRLVMSNESYQRIIGAGAECVQPGARYSDLLRAGLDQGRWADAIGREDAWLADHLEAHRQPHATFEQPLSDGRWFLVSERRTRSGGRAGLRIDITKLKATQAALEESRARVRRQAELLQDALDSLPDGFALYDRDARFVMCNRRFRELRAGNPISFQPGAPLDEILRSAIAYGEIAAPEGEEIESWIRKRVAFHKDAGNVPAIRAFDRWYRILRHKMKDGGIVAIHTDITELKESEEARESLEKQLVQMQRMEALGQLTGGIAHDFNNLLTVVLGGAEELREALADNPPFAELATTVRQAAERGADLTRRLLVFAREDKLAPRAVCVNLLVANAVPLVRPALGSHISVRTRLDPAEPAAMVDPSQFETVMLNLAVNSRDAMPNGGEFVIATGVHSPTAEELRRRPDVRPGPYALISVSDTGTGMPPEVLVRAFEPFFTTKEVGKGTGLGLSMVYGFVRQSGGYVDIESQPGAGTTVRVYLPVADAKGAASGSRVLPGGVGGGKETILVVEDDKLVAKHVAHQLRNLGYKPVFAEDGYVALDIVRSDAKIDLLFTDIAMPGGLSGFQVAERAATIRPGLKVLFTSGYANASEASQTSTAGFPMLRKPYRLEELASMVRSALGEAGPIPSTV